MSAGPARHLDALLDECLDVLGRIEARFAELSEGGGTPQGAEAASRLMHALAAPVEDGPQEAPQREEDPRPFDVRGLPSSRSTVCPSCGGGVAGIAQVVPAIALGRLVGALFVPSGETRLDRGAAAPLGRGWGAVLVCAACGGRWVNPLVALDGL